MLGKQTNPLLAQAETAIQAKVQPQNLPLFQRIVTAGQKVMYSPQTHDMMLKALSGPGNKADIAGEAASKLLGVLYHEMQGKLDMTVAIPAGVMLLCEGLDFMEKSGSITVDKPFLAQAMKSMMTSTLQLFGVTPQKLAQMKQGAAQGGAPGASPAGASAPSASAPAGLASPPAGIIAGAQGAM